MKTLQKNFTTPEQSKRLLELGVPVDSADLIQVQDAITTDEYIMVRNEDEPIGEFIENNQDILPCWSVGRLIEIYEKCTGIKFERWSHNGVLRPLLEDCIEHIKFAINPDTIMNMDFSKLEE